MKAAVYHAPGKIHVEERPIPEIDENEILIQVKASAICGTDLRIYGNGHFKIKPGQIRVLGHELAGKIVKVGSQVDGYYIGDRVATIPNIGCGHCKACYSGHNELCPDYHAFGIDIDGGFEEFMKIPSSAIYGGNVVQISDDLDYEEAALVEPLSCVVNCATRLRTGLGDTVLVIGAGPIGILHVMVSKLSGAKKVILVDLSDTRLAKGKKFGADVIVNSKKEKLQSILDEVTDGLGLDVVITACSVPELQEQALEIAGRNGRVCFFGGLPDNKNVVPLNTNLIHYKELTIVGSTGSSIADYRKAMILAESKRVNLSGIVSERFPLEKTEEAFKYAKSGEGLKTLIIP